MTMKKILYFMIGLLAMSLGALGVILPVLPTTPFLLLATVCFAKSSERFHHWFLQTSLYQKHLDSFVKERAMSLRTKITLLSFASTMLLLAMMLMNSLPLRIFLACLIAFKYYYFIFRIKTIPWKKPRPS